MKNKHFKFMALMLGITMSAISLTSCSDDDDDKGEAPAIADFTVAADNETATVVFNQAVYKEDNQTGDLDKAALMVTISGGDATLGDYTVTHSAGSNEATIDLTINGIATGDEVVTVKPAAVNSIYSALGMGIAATESKSANLNELGIIGKWYSSGTNVAPLLVNAGVDSVYANFKGDNTYEVESFTPDGSKTTLTGTFTQERSGTGEIWNITVNQSSPNSLVSEGIFELEDQTPLLLKYEIAQTDPAVQGVTPPTAEAGFGSTSGGAFGKTNIQKYLRHN